MDIGNNRGFLCSRLSNLQRRWFIFDGVECESIEGVLMAFKTPHVHIQEAVCSLWGKKAKFFFKGKKRYAWCRTQQLYWRGETYERHGREYQELLDRLYDAVAGQCPGFCRALLATGKAALTHSIGKNKPSETVLTRAEFCSRLTRIRTRLQEKGA